MPGAAFHATLELAGKTATGLPVPPEAVEALGSGKQPLVHVSINGHRYRSKVAVRGSEFRVPVSAEHREAAGIEAGDEVDVTLELDIDPREVALPEDFAQALDADPEARRFYDSLSNSQQQWYVIGIEGAKNDDTRRRRVDKAVARLREGLGNR